MMMRRLVFILIVIVYGLLFFQQEKHAQETPATLTFPIPGNIQKTVLGYLRQLGGEIHFIKTAVFLGGHFTNTPDQTYANSLARNFEVMADLHPHFTDTYFYCQSNLAHIGPNWAREVNQILSTGMAANPDNWILPYFKGFNHNHYLMEPGKAAEALKTASQIEGAPDWIAHLAAIRSGQGGDILAGLIWLKTILKTENNPEVQKRYMQDIAFFEQALAVQKAIIAFRDRYGAAPPALNKLIPEFIPGLPQFNGNFVLQWEPPVLRLTRPPRKSSM